jgi:ubiquinone/menaquinone biosynthesis C-methylase UbiE
LQEACSHRIASFLVAEVAGQPGDWREAVLEVKRPPEEVPAIYTRLAPIYEVWARATESKARRRVLEAASVQPGEDVLEVAAGTGVQLVRLAAPNPGGRTVGVEISSGMVARARQTLARSGLGDVELIQGSALELPFPNRGFDLLVNSYMLDLLPREAIPRALAEFRRVLRPGGRIVLSNMTKAERRRDGIWDWLYGKGIVLTANCRGVLAAPVLGELGFTDISREYLSQLTFPTEIVTARLPK